MSEQLLKPVNYDIQYIYVSRKVNQELFRSQSLNSSKTKDFFVYAFPPAVVILVVLEILYYNNLYLL